MDPYRWAIIGLAPTIAAFLVMAWQFYRSNTSFRNVVSHPGDTRDTLISGVAKGKTIFTSPLSKQRCCWWRCVIEVSNWGARDGVPPTRIADETPETYLHVQDGEREIAVDLETPIQNVEFYLSPRTEVIRLGDAQNLISAATGRRCVAESIYPNARLTEEVILEGSPVFIRGELLEREGPDGKTQTIIRPSAKQPMIVSLISPTQLMARTRVMIVMACLFAAIVGGFIVIETFKSKMPKSLYDTSSIVLMLSIFPVLYFMNKNRPQT